MMVVDDDLRQLQLIERMLKAEGFDVVSISEPIGASNLVRSFQPDVVLLDVNIPALSGDRLLSLIRKVAEPYARLVLHSSDDPESLRERAHKVGADAWIQKDFSAGQLASQLRRLLPSLTR